MHKGFFHPRVLSSGKSIAKFEDVHNSKPLKMTTSEVRSSPPEKKSVHKPMAKHNLLPYHAQNCSCDEYFVIGVFMTTEVVTSFFPQISGIS